MKRYINFSFLILCLLLVTGCNYNLNKIYKANTYSNLIKNHKSYKVNFKYDNSDVTDYMYFDGEGYYNVYGDEVKYYINNSGYTYYDDKIVVFADFDDFANNLPSYGTILEAYGEGVDTKIVSSSGNNYVLNSTGDLNDVFDNYTDGDVVVENIELNDNKELIKNVIELKRNDEVVYNLTINMEYDVDIDYKDLKEASKKENTVKGKFIYNNKTYEIGLNSESYLAFLSGYKYYSDKDLNNELVSSLDVDITKDFTIYVAAE